MNENPPIDLVSAALVECQGKLKSAHMDATNPFFKSKYATLGAVIEASRDALYNAGLFLQQNLDLHDGVVSVHTVIRHKSGQFIDGGTLSLPIGENDRNSDAQLAGSIATYLRRYSWSSILGIYADSDDDGNEAPKGAVARQTYQRPQQPNHPSKTPTSGNQGAAAPVMDEKVLARYRLKALNNLQAAPGQNNRVLFTHFAMAKGWINGNQEPEQIPAEHVPTTPEQMAQLVADVARFEAESKGVQS